MTAGVFATWSNPDSAAFIPPQEIRPVSACLAFIKRKWLWLIYRCQK